MTDQIWELHRGAGPIVATAIHHGHEVRSEVHEQMAISKEDRRREEDPYTGDWTEVAPTRVVGLRSRFEVDLNRPRERAVYRKPEDAWGLQIWKEELPEEIAQRSLKQYDRFYEALGMLYQELAEEHGTFVVFDLHTYNHRRNGPNGPLADPAENPQVNIGTGTMRSEPRFRPLLYRFMYELSNYDFPTGRLDVRENVKFMGGHHAEWTHQCFPEAACVISIEFKKFFMCEWSGKPERHLLKAVQKALASTVPGILEEVNKLQLIAH